MLVPPDFHWYVRSTGDGPQVPALAVSNSPTAAVPEMVGTAVVNVPVAATTAAVGELSRLTVVYPVLAPGDDDGDGLAERVSRDGQRGCWSRR